MRLFGEINLREFELLNHTADIGIKTYGNTIEDLFCNTAIAMFSLMADLDEVRPFKKFDIQIKGENEENLMIKWLNELLYLYETELCLFNKFDLEIENICCGEINSLTENNKLLLKASVEGEDIDLEKHHIKTHIKGATYHKLEIRKNKIYSASIFFDV